MSPGRALALALALAVPCAAGCLSPPSAAPDASDDSCPTIYAEEFAGEALDRSAWDPSKSYDVETISLQEDRLHLTVAPDEVYELSAIMSTQAFDPSAHTLVVDTQVLIDGEGDAFAGWHDATTDAYVGINVVIDRIGGQRGILGNPPGVSLCDGPCTPYDAFVHRYWRIRPGGEGTLVFEASPDGAAWTGVGVPEPIAPFDARIILWAECGVGAQVRAETESVAVSACDRR